MIKSFFGTKEWRLWAWGGGLLLTMMIWGRVQLYVKFNEWYGVFYDIVQKADDLEAFWKSIYDFSYIAFSLIAIAVAIYYFKKHYAFRWRQAITYYYLPHWEKREGNIEGASQRIQEDTGQFAFYLEYLGLGLFQSVLTLIAFIPILWMLSSKIPVPWLAGVDGALVWIALVTSIGGMAISYFVGIKLPKLEYENQRVEAAYRKHLVYSEDHIDYRDIPTIHGLFDDLRTNYFRMFNHYSYFEAWGVFYSQSMVIVPIIIAGPPIFTKVITLGVMMKVLSAFGKVNDSFSYFIDHWTEITKFISVIKRLREFEGHLIPVMKEA